jgi:hypothetical protein
LRITYTLIGKINLVDYLTKDKGVDRIVVLRLIEVSIVSNSFTENEIKILKASRDNEYDDALSGGMPWVFAVIDCSGLDPKVARGSLASLVKKEVIFIDDWEGKGRADDQVLSVPESKRELVLSLFSQ